MTLTPQEGLLADWIEAYAPTGEAPDEMHLATAVALLSAAIGWRAWIGWGETLEPVTVNIVLTGTSATARKSTTAGIARKVARLALKNEDGTTPTNPTLTVRDITHTSSKGLLKLVAPSGPDEAEEWERTPPPSNLFIWDEIGALLGRPGDTKGGDWKGDTRSTIMQFTAGRHGGIQLGSDQQPASRCAVSVLGTMTRAELEQRVTHGLITDGFLGRMLLIPYGDRPRYIAVPATMNRDQLAARDRIVQRLRWITNTEPFGEAFGHFTPDAIRLRCDWYDERTHRLDEAVRDTGDDTAVSMQAAHGRLQAAAVKLAVIHAISRHPIDTPPTDYQVTPHDVQWGIDFTDLTNQEIQSLTATAGMSIDEQFAEKVVGYLEKKGPTTRKKLLDSIRSARLSRDQKWRVIEYMHVEGAVDISKGQVGTTPADVVSLNQDSTQGADRRGQGADTINNVINLRLAGET